MLVTGQGEGRRAIVRFRPEWLLETEQSDDFSRGLEQWHAEQEIGPAQRFFRKRREAAQLITHPDDPKRQVLSVGKRDEEPPAGAVWNFPKPSAGSTGELTLRVRIDGDFQGATLAIQNRLFMPTDPAAFDQSTIRAELALAGRKFKTQAAKQFSLQPKQWTDITLPYEQACYACFRSLAESPDTQGLLIESVSAQARPLTSRAPTATPRR